MQYSENAINIIVTKSYKGIGRAWIVKNLIGHETIDKIVTLLNKRLKEPTSVEDFERRKLEVKKYLKDKFLPEDGLIALGDSQFPRYNGSVIDSEKPIFLFYRGNLELLNYENNIAVIGLTDPDYETKIIEEKIVSILVKYEKVIVSGLAFGCDSIAHETTLNFSGKTIAVLPSTLNNILPTKNRDLANRIVENGGLLISEYYEGYKSPQELKSRYQERDRLQALFSQCIILTASYAKNNQGNDSGSRLAMEYAKKYAISRAVIYDQENQKDNPKYDLNRQVISEQDCPFILNLDNVDKFITKVSQNKKPLTALF